MNFTAACDALRAKLEDGFIKLPVLFENADLAKPPNEGWVLCEVNQTDEQHIGMNGDGNNLYRNFGVVTIAVNIPRDRKIGQAEEWAEEIKALYQPKDYRGTELVILRRRIIKSGVALAKSRWSTVQVVVEFHADNLE